MESRAHMDVFEELFTQAKEGCLMLHQIMHKIVTDRTAELAEQMASSE